MKKNFFFVLIALTCLSFNSIATEIGVLDVDKIIKESKAMRYIQKSVSSKQESYQKEVTKKQEALERKQKKIEAKKNILSEEAFEKKVKKFEEEVDDLKKFVDRRQNSLKKASLESMSKVNDKIKDIISDLAEKKGLEVIVPANQALYYKDTLDISEEVLDILNDKLSKVKVNFE